MRETKVDPCKDEEEENGGGGQAPVASHVLVPDIMLQKSVSVVPQSTMQRPHQFYPYQTVSNPASFVNTAQFFGASPYPTAGPSRTPRPSSRGSYGRPRPPGTHRPPPIPADTPPPLKRPRTMVPDPGNAPWRNCSQPGCHYLGPGEAVEVHEADRHLIFPATRPIERSEEEETFIDRKGYSFLLLKVDDKLIPSPAPVIPGTAISLQTDEEVSKWLAERRAKWPSAKRIAEKVRSVDL